MAADGRHSTQLRNHIIEAFTFANATDRAAGTGYTIIAADVGKIAYQTDTGAYSRLTGVGPLAWSPITTGNAAGVDLSFLTRQSESSLSNEFSLASISSGVLKHTVSGGVSTPAQAIANTDYVTPTSTLFTTITANNQTGTTYTLVLADAGKVVECNNASAIALTVPPASSVAFPTGTVIEVWQQGAGQITLTPGAGVTIRSDGSKLKTTGQYATIGLRYRGSDEWVLSGDLAS